MFCGVDAIEATREARLMKKQEAKDSCSEDEEYVP